MTTQFPNHTKAMVQIEDVDGQEVERRLEFEFKGLDYIFVFCPPCDNSQEGATLTYVGDEERGRLSPRKYANKLAWEIANNKIGLQ